MSTINMSRLNLLPRLLWCHHQKALVVGLLPECLFLKHCDDSTLLGHTRRQWWASTTITTTATIITNVVVVASTTLTILI